MFLHGYGCSGKTFTPQIKYFERYFNCYAPDLKGFGENTKMPYPYGVEDYLNEVYYFMVREGILGADVIAHSFGARIVLLSSKKYPELFNKVVFTGGAGLKPKRSPAYYFKKCTFNFRKLFTDRGKLIKYYSKDYQSLTPVMKESFIKVVNFNLLPYAKFIKNETLLVYGDKDKETPLYMAKRLNKEIEKSALYVMKGAGHFCFLDRPNEFNAVVREFLLS